MKWKFFAVAGSVLIYGCAAQGVSRIDYKAPTPVKVNNEITVNKPCAQVWDKLVNQLSKSFYIVNSIDKASRTINLSFRTNRPSEYADCGSTHRTYVQGYKIETYDFETAGPSEFKVATPKQPDKNYSYYVNINRNTMLEGRAVVNIAPSERDSSSTVITVNTRYIWTLKVNGQVFAEHFLGKVNPEKRLPEETRTIEFTTNWPGKGIGNDLTICCSKGKLEGEILDMINK
ncbi:MAG TPA: hypothetical protein VFG19_03525 [Geobacteraceae bacterium]|nr:hypothetical protein [Geobacteraceae bacterium]